MNKIEVLKKINDWNIKRITELYESSEILSENKPFFEEVINFVSSDLKEAVNYIQGQINEGNSLFKLEPYYLLNLVWSNMFDFNVLQEALNKMIDSKSNKKDSEQLAEIKDELIRWEIINIELDDFATYMSFA